jgi:hypothetical protein
MKASVPDIVKSLQLMGCLALLLAAGFLMGTSVVESDIYRAFCLVAFFTSIIGIILVFLKLSFYWAKFEIRQRNSNFRKEAYFFACGFFKLTLVQFDEEFLAFVRLG